MGFLSIDTPKDLQLDDTKFESTLAICDTAFDIESAPKSNKIECFLKMYLGCISRLKKISHSSVSISEKIKIVHDKFQEKFLSEQNDLGKINTIFMNYLCKHHKELHDIYKNPCDMDQKTMLEEEHLSEAK